MLSPVRDSGTSPTKEQGMKQPFNQCQAFIDQGRSTERRCTNRARTAVIDGKPTLCGTHDNHHKNPAARRLAAKWSKIADEERRARRDNSR